MSKDIFYDKDIREPLFDFLEDSFGTVRILEEKRTGSARADVVMITPDYFFFLLEISKLAKRVTGTASTDMSAAAPVLMLCVFLLLELFSVITDILSVNQVFISFTPASDSSLSVLLKIFSFLAEVHCRLRVTL